MRRIVLVLPDWLTRPGEYSALEGDLPNLAALAASGTLFKLPNEPQEVLPEAAFLGIPPSMVPMAQGPLTVSALGADPPSGSVHFHLSLLSFGEGKVARVTVTSEEARAVALAAERLNTRVLTVVPGDLEDHGLVWEEGSIDLGVRSPQEIIGGELKPSLPEGDGERMLRRFIDDSINLLSELELNRIRVDHELPPLNLLWPWGHGFRLPVPNLAVRRGEVAQVESRSLRVHGLARLAGYKHGPRLDFGEGVKTDLERLARLIRTRQAVVVVLDGFESLRRDGAIEEIDWLTRELDKRLLGPIRTLSEEAELHLLLLASSPDGGLALQFDSRERIQSVVPFDERALEDRGLPEIEDWRIVGRLLAGE
jgi:2,3-bisphosphoglycerate-independent phosphoglycerate mutase